MTGEVNPLVRDGENLWPDAGSLQRQRMRRLYDTVTRGLARIHLRGAIALLDATGRLANAAAFHGPTPAEVGALFNWLPRRDLNRVARGSSALHLKNRAAIALVDGHRTADLASLVRWSTDSERRAIAEGRSGMLIVACHVGAFYGIRAALHGIDRPVFTMRDVATPDAVSRAAAIKRAVDALRAGELVVATLDGPGGTSTREVTCLGRRIVFRRGPFALARLTGAPLVPVVCAWTRRGHIEVRVAAAIERPARQPLDAIEFEDEMAVRTAHWLEAYLRTEPQEVWPSTLRNYLAAPVARDREA
jgi:hypothetical protein